MGPGRGRRLQDGDVSIAAGAHACTEFMPCLRCQAWLSLAVSRVDIKENRQFDNGHGICPRGVMAKSESETWVPPSEGVQAGKYKK